MTYSPITEVEVFVLEAKTALLGEDLDSAAETLIVRIHDEEGRVGVGETDSASPAVQALIMMAGPHSLSMGLRQILIGKDPVQIGAIWDLLAASTVYNGSLGVARHALAAIDIALHDLAGKQLERPAFHLLGGARRTHVEPYATLYGGSVNGRSLTQMIDAMAELVDRALAHGFRSIKYEALFEDLASDRHLVDIIKSVRSQIGSDVRLLIDFGYRWTDWRDALWTLNRLETADIWLAEATLQHDDYPSHAKLAQRVETRVGGGEFAASLQECRNWLEVGKVDCLQPDVARAGGLTEMRRITELAEQHGAIVVPHCWKTGINFAAASHLQAASRNVPLVEMFVPGFFPSTLREELVSPEPELIDGKIKLPDAPGLGVLLADEILTKFQQTSSISQVQGYLSS
ncbi:MAG: mandelate racemase/muconate lactonizing enzyme family protein [Chloroflexi bacterium]|nr:mandelate racemase/muconate lactonizing enzyme family protein [Chloroflexota bacterium]